MKLTFGQRRTKGGQSWRIQSAHVNPKKSSNKLNTPPCERLPHAFEACVMQGLVRLSDASGNGKRGEAILAVLTHPSAKGSRWFGRGKLYRGGHDLTGEWMGFTAHGGVNHAVHF